MSCAGIVWSRCATARRLCSARVLCAVAFLPARLGLDQRFSFALALSLDDSAARLCGGVCGGGGHAAAAASARQGRAGCARNSPAGGARRARRHRLRFVPWFRSGLPAQQPDCLCGVVLRCGTRRGAAAAVVAAIASCHVIGSGFRVACPGGFPPSQRAHHAVSTIRLCLVGGMLAAVALGLIYTLSAQRAWCLSCSCWRRCGRGERGRFRSGRFGVGRPRCQRRSKHARTAAGRPQLALAFPCEMHRVRANFSNACDFKRQRVPRLDHSQRTARSASSISPTACLCHASNRARQATTPAVPAPAPDRWRRPQAATSALPWPRDRSRCDGRHERARGPEPSVWTHRANRAGTAQQSQRCRHWH